MGKCKYCGLSANLFSCVHSECEEKHKKSVAEMSAILRSFFVRSDGFTSIYRTDDLKGYSVEHFIMENIGVGFLMLRTRTLYTTHGRNLLRFHIGTSSVLPHIQMTWKFIKMGPMLGEKFCKGLTVGL